MWQFPEIFTQLNQFRVHNNVVPRHFDNKTFLFSSNKRNIGLLTYNLDSVYFGVGGALSPVLSPHNVES